MIGPILVGTEKPVQIVTMSATVGEILNMAALAASRCPEETVKEGEAKKEEGKKKVAAAA